MTYNQALAEIVTWITDNNNKEITAAVMRDVLTTLLDYSADNIGDTGDLFAETNTVDAINELKSLIDGIDLTLGLQVHNGTADPNVTPPSGGYNAPDIYVREDDALREVYIFNGVLWIKIINFSFPIYEAGIFKGNAASLDFVGGNFTLTFDANTGVMSVAVTGEGVDALDDIGDVPAYPNDGSEYVLVELDGDLTWELKAGGGGGQVDSVTGDSVDNTDPANPVVNAIPLSGTEVGSPVTGDIEFESIDSFYGLYSDKDGDYEQFIGFTDEGIPVISKNAEGDLTSLRIESGGIRFSTELTGSSAIGIHAEEYYGANYTDNTYVQKKYVDDNFVDESALINTLRSFSKPQWLDVAVLTPVSNVFTPDLGTAGSFTADIGANSTLANPTIPSGYDTGKVLAWDITFTITGAGGWTLAFGDQYFVDADVDIAAIIAENNTTGDVIQLFFQFKNNVISVQPFIPTAIP